MTELGEFEGGLKQQSRILFSVKSCAMCTSVARTVRLFVSPVILRVSLTVSLKKLKGAPIAFPKHHELYRDHSVFNPTKHMLRKNERFLHPTSQNLLHSQMKYDYDGKILV